MEKLAQAALRKLMRLGQVSGKAVSSARRAGVLPAPGHFAEGLERGTDKLLAKLGPIYHSTDSIMRKQGYIDKLALAIPMDVASIADSLTKRTPWQALRLAGSGAIGYGAGMGTGLWNPGDPEHRTFSGQMQGLGGAIGAGAGGMTGYHIADQLAESVEGSKGNWRNAALRFILPLVLGSAGAAAGGMAGHTVAGARYTGNTVWEKATGQPTYDERRKEKVKKALGMLAAAGILGGAGYGGYLAYNNNRDADNE